VRYKVRAPSDSTYRDFLSLLEGKVQLFVTSARRRLIATGDLPDEYRTEIIAQGGEITEDRQYGLERSASG
jgi:hypothetical protein